MVKRRKFLYICYKQGNMKQLRLTPMVYIGGANKRIVKFDMLEGKSKKSMGQAIIPNDLNLAASVLVKSSYLESDNYRVDVTPTLHVHDTSLESSIEIDFCSEYDPMVALQEVFEDLTVQAVLLPHLTAIGNIPCIFFAN